MPRKAAKRTAASRKHSVGSVADDASDVSSVVGDVANLASLDDFDEKENAASGSGKLSIVQKSKLRARNVLARTQLLRAFDMEGMLPVLDRLIFIFC